MKVGYIRVSTVEQNLDRQIAKMQELGVEKVFSEKISGKSKANREQLNNMLDFIREGDVVYVSEFARLARNTLDLLEIVEKIKSKGASLISCKEQLDLGSSSGQLFLTILSGLAQFEREMILERQAEGIAEAKKKGVYRGRQPKKIAGIEEYYKKYMAREMTVTEIAKKCKVTRQTIYHHFEALKQAQ